MRKRLASSALVVAVALLVPALTVAAAPATLGRITAKAAILMNRHTHEVIWQRNADLPLPPASTTKVLTTLVALRSAHLDDVFTVSEEAAQAPPSKVHLRPGWRLTLEDLAYAILLNSANDAAEVVAENVAGSIPAFARRMMRQARQVGAVNSFFVNPHGLPAAGHVSTARDLALIFDEALQEPEFRRIVSTQRMVIEPERGLRRPIRLHNHNRLLDRYKVPVVGKTGWTIAAKKCFVGAALPDTGPEILVAVLGSKDLWGDVTKLLNYGLSGDRFPEPPDLQMAQADADAVPEPPPVGAGDSEELSPAPPRRAHRHAHRPALRSAPASPASENGSLQSYAVQLATFESPDRARELVSAAERKGYKARIRRIARSNRTMYRVTMGDFASHGAARSAAARMRHEYEDLRPLVVAPST